MELENLKNARSRDVWLSIAFTAITVGLFALSWFHPNTIPLTSTIGAGSALSTFGMGAAIKYKDTAIEKIMDHEVDLH